MQVEILGLDKLNKSEQNTVAKTIKSILDGADLKDYSININLVDDEAMEDLHFRFKKKKKTTDVLSFPLPEMERQFAHTKDILGDVVISVNKAREQALEFGHSLPEEIAVLTAHGLFHLLGYDHEVSEDEASMQMQGEMYLLECAGFAPQLSLLGRA